MKYAHVAVMQPAVGLDRSFTYRVPSHLEESIGRGCAVSVPFGRRTLPGYVLDLADESGDDVPADQIREIAGAPADVPPLGRSALGLLAWLREYFGATLFEALQVLVPAPVRALASRSGRKSRAKAPDGESAARGMEEQRPAVQLRLSPHQEKAIQEICGAIGARRPAVALLEGVTGSGKTQVYIESIRHCLRQGLGAIVLVPEIALTAQAVERFRGALDVEVALIHSGLTDAERVREWRKISSGDAPVVLGTRSAVFAPVRRPGLIILDEEHEESFKEHQRSPRYGARQVAVKRAMLERSVVVLGSATPSVESFYWAGEGKYLHLVLPERIKGRNLARCRIVDMSGPEMKRGGGTIGPALREAIDIRLRRGEKVLLLQNRRGFSTLLCRECGNVPSCPHCAIALTYHRGPAELRCHYCFHRAAAPDTCGKCGGDAIRYQGTGTQRVEEELTGLFPGTPVYRMDLDSTRGRNAHGRILSSFRDAGAAILIGTQMIAKGLDIPEVTLAGVVDADVTLGIPDFRAAERTFQLIMQVAGRAGRGNVPGEVIIQTRNPSHPILLAAAAQNYRAFYAGEIAMRRELGYPPFTHLVNVLVTSTDEGAATAACSEIEKLLQGFENIAILGPAPCLLAKIRGNYRWHVTLKVARVPEVMAWLSPLLGPFQRKKGMRVSVDVDPMSLM